jgi:hypothetical protein
MQCSVEYNFYCNREFHFLVGCNSGNTGNLQHVMQESVRQMLFRE